VELESKIANNIRELKITRISIAHRPQTIASADRAIELTPQAQ
jgi:ABC-type bacteriocin/lantibiotic exporter with double-glycine peptidase domain